jgi:hypothetical protein
MTKKQLGKKWLGYSMDGKKAVTIYHSWKIGGEQTGRWEKAGCEIDPYSVFFKSLTI